MKFVITVLIVGLSLVAGLSCERAKTERGRNVEAGGARASDNGLDGRAPPLAEAPLLLDDEHEHLLLGSSMEEIAGGADNRRCYVCHVNYLQDEIAVTHARAGIGCADCHGESDEHIDDESWSWGGPGTAPDIMYVRVEINSSCFGCHSASTLSRGAHHSVVLTGSNEKVCTDCHGDHRLPIRRTEWK